MDKRILIIVGLTLGGFLIWQNYMVPKSTPTSSVSAPVVEQPSVRYAQQTMLAKDSEPTLAAGPAFFSNWKVPSTSLENLTNYGDGQLFFAFDHQDWEYLNRVSGKFTETSPGKTVWTYEDDKILLTRTFRSTAETYFFDVEISARFKKNKPGFAFVSLKGRGIKDDPEAVDRAISYWKNNSIQTHLFSDSFDAVEPIAEPLKWISIQSRYFLFTVVNHSPIPSTGLIQSIEPNAARLSLVYPVASDSLTIPLRVYFGPKNLDVLHQIEPTLDHTVDYGWFAVVAYPLFKIMKWFYDFTKNYGVAIILLTILVKVATLPLTYKSMKSMKEMARLQPLLKRIQDKYKDDREGLQREMMSFMKTHKYNPMAGCWPMLVQMPIFFALYRVLYSSYELYQAPFGFWIHDLSSKDPYYILPILVSLTWFLQQRLTPMTTTDPIQKKMFQFMPLLFGLFMITLPAGLGIYFFVNAALGIVQQLYFNKKLGIGPGNTPEKTDVVRA